MRVCKVCDLTQPRQLCCLIAECSGNVRSEFCCPILDAAGHVLGIIDAEAWRPQHFDDHRVLQFLKVRSLLAFCLLVL